MRTLIRLLSKLHLLAKNAFVGRFAEKFTNFIKQSEFQKKFILILFFPTSLYATEYAPWFTPPWEIQGEATYAIDRQNRIQSLQGSFSEPFTNQLLRFGLGVTPWPYWNIEAELYFAHAPHVDFGYEAFLITARYQWLDDVASCVPMSLATGVTLSFPGKRFLHEFSFPYHGNVNALFHATIGKELVRKNFDWCVRLWSLGGIGIANKGSPWIHGIGALEWKPTCFLQTGFFVDVLYGFGGNDIIEEIPFPGYASIGYQTVDLAAEVRYIFETIGTLIFEGWYNVHARNFPERYFGFALRFQIPFSF